MHFNMPCKSSNTPVIAKSFVPLLSKYKIISFFTHSTIDLIICIANNVSCAISVTPPKFTFCHRQIHILLHLGSKENWCVIEECCLTHHTMSGVIITGCVQHSLDDLFFIFTTTPLSLWCK
jgi:hypothetical protein